MTNDTAKIVISILMEADGGCSVCTRYLLQCFRRRFPSVPRSVYEEAKSEDHNARVVLDEVFV